MSESTQWTQATAVVKSKGPPSFTSASLTAALRVQAAVMAQIVGVGTKRGSDKGKTDGSEDTFVVWEAIAKM